MVVGFYSARSLTAFTANLCSWAQVPGRGLPEPSQGDGHAGSGLQRQRVLCQIPERFRMARGGCNCKAVIVFHVNVCFGLCLNDYLSLICVPNYYRFKLFSIILFSIRCDPKD